MMISDYFLLSPLIGLVKISLTVFQKTFQYLMKMNKNKLFQKSKERILISFTFRSASQTVTCFRHMGASDLKLKTNLQTFCFLVVAFQDKCPTFTVGSLLDA